jgi:hypothetical protein
MITVDDRTPEQKKTHYWGVVGRDRFMSGWGGAKGGHSRACWVVPMEDAIGSGLDRAKEAVEDRSDMQYVNIVNLRTYRPPRGTAHFHIYIYKGFPS